MSENKLPAEGGAMFYPENGPKCRCVNRKPGEPCIFPECTTPSTDSQEGERVYR